jgi:hypothetical protein
MQVAPPKSVRLQSRRPSLVFCRRCSCTLTFPLRFSRQRTLLTRCASALIGRWC